MPVEQNRRNFLQQAMQLGSAALLLPVFTNAQTRQDKPAPLDPTMVSEFVRVSHGNLDQVKKLLEKQPLLLNASWDWGGGDFETGMGAASHIGRRDIVEYLLSKGARYDLFTMTMLGNTPYVKNAIDQFPALLNGNGPHGLTLLHHAEKGGAAAKDLYDYFIARGLTEKKVNLFS